MIPPANPAVAKGSFSVGVNVRVAIKLLESRQQAALAVLTFTRIAVGFCDLAVAAAMYLLFLLLQGRLPAHQLWWIPQTTLSAAAVTSALVALRALMDLCSARSVTYQIQKLYTDLLLRLTQGYNEMHWVRFVEVNRSELSNHSLYTALEASEYYRQCVELTAAVVIVIAMATALVCQSTIAACGFAVALSTFYGMHRLFIRNNVREAAERRDAALRTLQRNLTDMFSSGKEIRTYRNHEFFQDRIREQARHIAASNLRIKILPQVAASVSDQGAVLLFLCMIVAIALRHGDSRHLLSLLAFYFVLSRRLIPLISQISNIAGRMGSSYESVRIVSAELDRSRRHRAPRQPSPRPEPGLVAQLKGVSFSFREGLPILRNINLSLRENEVVVVRGSSGIGKSSLLNLMAGVSQPTAGIIQVDRESIAYVPQEIALLDDSIRNNLLFGLRDKSDEELLTALTTAQLVDFVAAQPAGLDTGVGDNGALFSGGQRQRLGLARAILRGARLLLLDEATSALDADNERKILENLSASGKTVVLVTHRVLNQVFGHRVFRLRDGSLTEEFPNWTSQGEHTFMVGVKS